MKTLIPKFTASFTALVALRVTLLTSILFIGLLPVIYLVLGNESLDLDTIKNTASHADTVTVSLQTAKFACITALIASSIGWYISHLLRFHKYPHLIIGLHALCFVISPYIAAQGWIQVMGADGVLWQILAIQPKPEMIYSRLGMVFLMCLQFIPLSLIIFSLTRPSLSRESLELQKLVHITFWKRIYLFHISSNKLTYLFSLTLIFWLSFWNYETPSILRLNTYALSLYAAFGSFYDYNQALGYLLHAVIYGVPTLFVILKVTPALSANIRSLAPSYVRSNNYLKTTITFLVCGLVPFCGLVIPLISIIIDLGGTNTFERLTKTLIDYKNDIGNTLIVASITSVITLALCLFFVWITSLLKNRKQLSIPSLSLFMIPPLCTGIGMVHWFTENSSTEAGLERIIIVNLLILLPILLLPVSIAFPEKSSSQSDVQKLYKMSFSKRITLFARPLYLPRLLLLFGFGFLMVMREVPASLLNYPPDGSTIALTIETMLHFDQPQLISALCLIQLLLSLTVFSTIALFSNLSQR